jgi:predicted nucleotidyltransferase
MGKYRQMLIDEQAHNYIKDAKALLGQPTGKHFSSKDVINELIGKRVRYLELKKEIRDYINEFASNAASDLHVYGLLLFGSVAKNNYGKYSDIDILVIADVKDSLGYFDKISKMVKNAEPVRKDLLDNGLYLHISPLVLSTSELEHFRPIYINFLEEGIILFERKDAMTNFLNSIRKNVIYEHTRINDVTVIKWRIKK